MRKRQLTGAIPILLLAAGCTVPPMPATGVPSGDELSAYRERFADDLRGYIEVELPNPRRTHQNLLRVSVPIRNVAGEDLRLLIQIQFVDESGSFYNDETNRRIFLLPRGTTKAFEATSQQSIARDYVMHIWRAP